MKYLQMDLNADAGESFGNYRYGDDEGIMPYLSSVNIACGFHAGDPRVMRKTVRLAMQHGVAVGAHVGLPDLLGFGRRVMDIGAEEMRDYVVYQVGALKAFVEAEGGQIHHVGPHGELAASCRKNPEVGEAFAAGVHEAAPKAAIIGRPGLPTFDAAVQLGHKGACQVGLDLEYRPDRTAILQRVREYFPVDRAMRRLRQILIDGAFPANDGTIFDFPVNTLLVHSDTPNAAELLKSAREEMARLGVECRAF